MEKYLNLYKLCGVIEILIKIRTKQDLQIYIFTCNDTRFFITTNILYYVCKLLIYSAFVSN